MIKRVMDTDDTEGDLRLFVLPAYVHVNKVGRDVNTCSLLSPLRAAQLVALTLPILRLLSTKAQRCKDF